MPAKPGPRTQVNDRVIQRVKVKLEERAKRLQAHRLTIGIHEAEGSRPKLDYNGNETAISLVAVAAAHELGKGVPERSWLRTWFDSNRARLEQEMVEAARKEYSGSSGAIQRQGEEWAHDLQEWIEAEDGGLQALAPATVAAKERAGLQQPGTPLFATGELVAAIKSMLDGGTT